MRACKRIFTTLAACTTTPQLATTHWLHAVGCMPRSPPWQTVNVLSVPQPLTPSSSIVADSISRAGGLVQPKEPVAATAAQKKGNLKSWKGMPIAKRKLARARKLPPWRCHTCTSVVCHALKLLRLGLMLLLLRITHACRCLLPSYPSPQTPACNAHLR